MNYRKISRLLETIIDILKKIFFVFTVNTVTSTSELVVSKFDDSSTSKTPTINTQSIVQSHTDWSIVNTTFATPDIQRPIIMERSTAMESPEMNTIPLELERGIVQHKKIREMQRRNSVCVTEFNNHQKQILNKFANSITQRKVNLGDILENMKKIWKRKTPEPSGSSSASSSSSSSSSSSESSSSDSSSSDSGSSSSSSGKGII